MIRRLLLLEDEPILRRELTHFLGREGWDVEAIGDISGFRQAYDAGLHRIAIIDLSLPDGDGMALIRELRSHGNPLGIVVLTAPITICRKPATWTKSPPLWLRCRGVSRASCRASRPGCWSAACAA